VPDRLLQTGIRPSPSPRGLGDVARSPQQDSADEFDKTAVARNFCEGYRAVADPRPSAVRAADGLACSAASDGWSGRARRDPDLAV